MEDLKTVTHTAKVRSEEAFELVLKFEQRFGHWFIQGWGCFEMSEFLLETVAEVVNDVQHLGKLGDRGVFRHFANFSRNQKKGYYFNLDQ